MNTAAWPAWDMSGLGPQLRGRESAKAMASCLRAARALAKTPLEKKNFPALVDGYQEVLEQLDRIAAVAELRAAASAADPDTEALRQRVLKFQGRVKRALLPFELAWAKLGQARAAGLLVGLKDHPAGHGLAKARALGPYRLDQAREGLLAGVLEPVRSAWAAQWRELSGAVRAGGRLGLMAHPAPKTRARAAKRLEAALRSQAGLFCRTLWGTVTAERLEDQARGYPHWLFPRAASEETTPEEVDRLTGQIRQACHLAAGYYRLKAGLLGQEVLAGSDRLAPPLPEKRLNFRAMSSLVLAGLGRISPELADLAKVFFSQGRIDAGPRPGKVPGAFCRAVGQGDIPYIMLNARGQARDAAVLAHELGHGLHHMLAADQGYIGCKPTLALAEAVAVCCELALFEERLDRAETDRDRLLVLCQRLEDDITTVFRQAVFHGFEHGLRGLEIMTAPDLAGLWLKTQDELCQGAVAGHDPNGWAVVPHFFLLPGYVNIYARAGCLAWAIWQRRPAMGCNFYPAFRGLLEAGGSKPLAELVAPFGLEPGHPDMGKIFFQAFATNLEQARDLSGLT